MREYNLMQQGNEICGTVGLVYGWRMLGFDCMHPSPFRLLLCLQLCPVRAWRSRPIKMWRVPFLTCKPLSFGWWLACFLLDRGRGEQRLPSWVRSCEEVVMLPFINPVLWDGDFMNSASSSPNHVSLIPICCFSMFYLEMPTSYWLAMDHF